MNASRAHTSYVSIAGYGFSGPFLSSKYLHFMPGVYVIVDVLPDKTWTVIDVRTVDDVRAAVDKHNRGSEWHKHRRGELAAAAHYAHTQAERDKLPGIQARIRSKYRPPCR